MLYINAHVPFCFSCSKIAPGISFRKSLWSVALPTVRPNGITDREKYCRINCAFHSRYRYRQKYFELFFRSRCRHSCSLQFWGWRIADRNHFGITFYFIAETDTEKDYFRIISAMNPDKRGVQSTLKDYRFTRKFANHIWPPSGWTVRMNVPGFTRPRKESGKRGLAKTVTKNMTEASVRRAPDTFNFLRHVMRAIWSVRPKCSHRCVFLKETSLKPVQSLKHTTKNSAEQTVMRTKWFKHIAI